MNAKDLVTNIDPCTGQGRASVPLLFQVGRGGLDLLLSIAYDSGTLGVATRWNQDAPTGIVGLGWGIARDRIFARYEQSLVAGTALWHLQTAYQVGLRPSICSGTLPTIRRRNFGLSSTKTASFILSATVPQGGEPLTWGLLGVAGLGQTPMWPTNVQSLWAGQSTACLTFLAIP
jgi:hypothetical protein